MFVYLSILMGLLVIGTFSLVWERRWKGFRAAAKEAAQSAPSRMALRARVTEGLAVVRANLPFRQSTSVAIAPFRTWSTQALADDAALLQWLAALSEEAYAAFVEHVAEFTAEMGFSLTDLVTGHMACLPDAAQQARAVVTHFCRANYQAALAQRDFDGYRAYAEYLQAPMSVTGQQFTQQLYAQLVEQQLAPAPTPELLALTEAERLAQMQAAIHHAAESPEAFRPVLQAVVADQQRTAADFTVAQIVQRAMTRVGKSSAAANPSTSATTQEAAAANAESTAVAV